MNVLARVTNSFGSVVTLKRDGRGSRDYYVIEIETTTGQVKKHIVNDRTNAYILFVANLGVAGK